MTDRELLELAAKAAGYKLSTINSGINEYYQISFIDGMPNYGHRHPSWNPLTDDGDALRLAVKLRIDVDNDHPECCVVPEPEIIEYYRNNNNDPYAATRRAIVRAAAEVGKGME